MKARKMGNGIFFAIFAVVMALGSHQANAYDPAEDLLKSCMAVAKTDCSKWAAEGGGGGLPRGLTNGTTVELAQGERYVLTGVIAVVKNSSTQQNEAYLKIDLEEHPWLASAKRRSTPYYRINDDANRWKKYNRSKITGIFRAEGAIWSMGQERGYEVFLTPTEGTVIVNGGIR